MKLPLPNGQPVLVALTLAVATGCAFLFSWAHLPLAYLLGALTGAALVANLVTPMKGGRPLRQFSQLFVGASVAVLLDAQVIEELLRLFPLMVAVAIAGNLAGFLLAVPIAALSGIDRISGVLACLPAGMAEMATLAREIDADEQSVAIIHTLRVIIVLTVVPVWLVATGHPIGSLPAAPHASWMETAALVALLAASLVLAVVATRLQVINAFIVVPTMLSVLAVALGFRIPAVPSPILVAAQIGIGVSLGLRFRLDRMSRLPRTVIGGVVSSLALIALAIFGFGLAIEHLAGLDHLSALISAAPGGLGEMIATANSLGLAAASVAGFQLTRSIFTNVVVAPLIRGHITRRKQ